MRTSLHNKVVVITGASSGLGRAAALLFARKGATVVLGARNVSALRQVAAACRRRGGEAVVFQTDVTSEKSVRRLARKALGLTGRIDVWVNNAGVAAFGILDEVPFEHHQRVVETNVYGAMYGARAVMPVFRRQHAGVLINVSSILGKVSHPYVPSYVISKHAVQGLSETLRTTFADEPDIHICTLLPYAFNSPHFEHGANHLGLRAHAMAPMQTPRKVARALVSLAERPRRELHVPRYAALGLAFHSQLPALADRLILHLTREWLFGHRSESRTSGNLYSPRPGRVQGRRPARTTLPRMLLWGAADFLLSAGRERRRGTSLRPHAVT